MAVVTVSMTTDLSCHFWFMPDASVSLSGGGVNAPEMVEGFVYGGTPLSVQLDNAFTWDIIVLFRNAAPVIWEGFIPGSGGDLLQLLTAQGWVQ